MTRHNDYRPFAGPTARQASDSPQRWTVQVIEMSMGDQNGVDGRQIAQAQSGTAKALEDENPLREIGIDDEILATHLDEKTGVSNESDAKLLASSHDRLARTACAWSQYRFTDKG